MLQTRENFFNRGKRGGILSEQPSLGTITKKLSFGSTGRFKKQRSTEERAEEIKDQRLLRWALQAEARAFLPKERMAQCLRKVVPIAAGVEVYHSPEHQKAHYGGLFVCGSVWMCPLCGAKISERRPDE